jgi:hypothetical protein
MKSELQPLVDCVADRLLAWKGHLMHCNGCLTLIKTTLFVVPVYTSIGTGLDPWIIRGLQKIMKAFLLIGTDTVQVLELLNQAHRKFLIIPIKSQKPIHAWWVATL